MEAFAARTQAAPGGSLRLAIRLSVDEGWHVNSHLPTQDYLIATALSLPDDWASLGPVQYPPGQQVRLSISDEPLSVYQGSILIDAAVQVPKDAKLGPHELTLALAPKCATTRSCLQPQTLRLAIPVEVATPPNDVPPPPRGLRRPGRHPQIGTRYRRRWVPPRRFCRACHGVAEGEAGCEANPRSAKVAELGPASLVAIRYRGSPRHPARQVAYFAVGALPAKPSSIICPAARRVGRRWCSGRSRRRRRCPIAATSPSNSSATFFCSGNSFCQPMQPKYRVRSGVRPSS